VILLSLTMACAPDAVTPSIEPYDPVPYVDPMVATGGQAAAIASVTPAASAPNGLVLVGPDTRLESGSLDFYHCAGYHWDDTHITGFSHTHAHGMGVTDYGGVQVMPRASWSPAFTEETGRMAPLDHASERATPGRYAITLPDDGTTVEIVATPRGAIHTFTFVPGSSPTLVVDLGHALGSDDTIPSSSFAYDPVDGQLEARQVLMGSYSGRYGGAQHHAVFTFDPPATGGGTWDDPAAPRDGALEVSADGPVGGWLTWPEGTTTVTARVALSYTDFDGAWRNHEAEVGGFSASDALANTEWAWRDQLSRLRIAGSESVRARAHTAHYHTLLMPSVLSDVDGRYRGVDQAVHTSATPIYSDLSLWDTFRTLHPWYILAHPELQRDVLRSLVQMSVDGGGLPRWPLAHGNTGGMVGTPATQVIAESWLKGMTTDWDVQTAFDYALAAASGPVPADARDAIEDYLSYGFVPRSSAGGAASLTLEYAWSDHSLALLADDLGRSSEALWAQSRSWQNTWSAEHGYFLAPEADGTFVYEPGDDFVWLSDFVEGNALHYRWYVPYDVGAMIDLQHGGDVGAFLDLYQQYWYEGVFTEPDDLVTDDWYWHGNEPVLHYAWLGSLAGDRDTTVVASRWVAEARYGLDPQTGLDGNDDAGTLSAWYLFAVLGFYPVAGTDLYALGQPMAPRVELDRGDGSTLVIEAPGAGPESWVAGPVFINGAPVTEPTFRHSVLVSP
jgi:putative alpha-1,2-mannosidase